ncbi:unnamed protein product, partial [Iphiclides podalirius]
MRRIVNAQFTKFHAAPSPCAGFIAAFSPKIPDPGSRARTVGHLVKSPESFQVAKRDHFVFESFPAVIANLSSGAGGGKKRSRSLSASDKSSDVRTRGKWLEPPSRITHHQRRSRLIRAGVLKNAPATKIDIMQSATIEASADSPPLRPSAPRAEVATICMTIVGRELSMFLIWPTNNAQLQLREQPRRICMLVAAEASDSAAGRSNGEV